MAKYMLLPLRAGRRLSPVPVRSLQAVTKWLGYGTGIATVRWSEKTEAVLKESAGVELLRNGERIARGFLLEVEDQWPEDALRVAWVGEEILLAQRLVIPDPTRAGNDQTTLPRWTRSGVASTVMTTLLTEQLGPTAHPMWRVPGLTIGTDPVVGSTVTAAIRYGTPHLLGELQTLSAKSGTDLGIRVVTGPTGPTISVLAPVDRTATAIFSADLRNLLSYRFTRKAPTVTDLIVAGKGPEIEDQYAGNDVTLSFTPEQRETYRLTHAPQVVVSSTDPITTAWGFKVWGFKDQSSLSDPAALTAAGQADLVDGESVVALTCTLRDTARLQFGRDWGLGSRVTVLVGRPKRPKTPITDVVREIAFEFGPDGERITPAIGTTGATALPTLPTRQAINQIQARLAGLERSA